MSVLLVSWDGPEHGARAMARDRVLTTLIAPGAGISGLIRFHGWSRPCLSLGRAQRVEAERLA
ncbi:MAG: hypothetical protein OEQ13_11280, partial [Acidobacteriota bacterium]|nr:hypothetical protein [Acidobacteriota bacterium]